MGNGYFESEMIYYNITEINLLVPYYENAKEIIIYDENLIEITREDIGMYSKQYEKENIVNESVEKEIDKKNQIEEERIYDKKNLFEKLKIILTLSSTSILSCFVLKPYALHLYFFPKIQVK